jgi:hypothetical protein
VRFLRESPLARCRRTHRFLWSAPVNLLGSRAMTASPAIPLRVPSNQVVVPLSAGTASTFT